MRRTARLVALLVVGLGSAPGCVALYQYRTAEVTVTDAATRHPAPDVEVEVSYVQIVDVLNMPEVSTARTDAEGRATVRIARVLNRTVAMPVFGVRWDGRLWGFGLPDQAIMDGGVLPTGDPPPFGAPRAFRVELSRSVPAK